MLGGMDLKKNKKRNPWLALLFMAYTALMLYLLFIRNRSGVDGLPYWEQVLSNYNLAPGRTIGSYWDVLNRSEHYLQKWGQESYQQQARFAMVNLVGNVVMFIPFGAFLPALWWKMRRAWKTIPFAVLTIALVEALQLITLRGKCDVDDLLLNFVGVSLGYALWRLCQKHHRKHR